MTDTERLDRLEQKAREWGKKTGITGGWTITASGTVFSCSRNSTGSPQGHAILREAIDAMEGGENAK